MSKAADARKVLAKHGPELMELACRLATGKATVEELAQPGCLPIDTKLLATLVRQLPNVKIEDDPPPASLGQVKDPEERAERAINEFLAGKLTVIQAKMIIDLYITKMDAGEASRLLRMFEAVKERPRGFM